MFSEIMLSRPSLISWRQPGLQPTEHQGKIFLKEETRIALPGVPRENIEVEVTGRDVTVSVKSPEKEELVSHYHATLQPGQDPESLKAHYADGLLTLSVTPSTPEKRVVPLT